MLHRIVKTHICCSKAPSDGLQKTAQGRSVRAISFSAHRYLSDMMSPMSPACKRFYPVAVMIQNVVAHSRTKKSGHARDPHARPHTRDPSFFIPWQYRLEEGPNSEDQAFRPNSPAETAPREPLIPRTPSLLRFCTNLLGLTLYYFILYELLSRPEISGYIRV